MRELAFLPIILFTICAGIYALFALFAIFDKEVKDANLIHQTIIAAISFLYGIANWCQKYREKTRKDG